MKVMVIVKANAASEAGAMPTEQNLADMGAFNEELVRAGVMQAGEGLHPSSAGKRVRYTKAGPTVVDGPFAETKELVAGFWIWKVGSMQEAVEWARRIPMVAGDADDEPEVEIRPVFETEDFAESDPSGELRAAEHRLRAEVERQQGAQA